MVFSVHPSVPAKTLKELIALARARPGVITYATSGAGTGHHLAGELFKSLAKIDMIHVPYQGGAPAAIAVMGGHTSVLLVNILSVAPHVRNGQAARAGRNLSRALRDAEGRSDRGRVRFSRLRYRDLVRLGRPSATPKEAVNRLSAEILRALQLPEVKDIITRIGMNAAGLPAAEFDAFLRAELRSNEKIARAVNLRID